MPPFEFQQATSSQRQPRLSARYDRTRYFAHHKRDPEREAGPVITSRDRLLLRLVHGYRVLDTKTLGLLSHFDTDESTFNRRLRKLWRTGFLDRCAEAEYLKFKHIEPCLVWALGPRGYEVLAVDPDLKLPLDHRRQNLRMTQKNVEIKPSTLLHDLGNNKARACIELGAEEHPFLRLVYWKSRPEDITFKVQVPEHQLRLLQSSQKMISVRPDGSFCLQHITESEPNRAHYFWEWDRGSADLTRWLLKKGFGYGELWRTGLCSRLRGFNFFNILNIAQTEARRDNMRKAVEKWLQKAKQQGFEYPPSLWLFAEAKHFRTEAPRAALEERIWFSVGQEKPVSLLEV